MAETEPEMVDCDWCGKPRYKFTMYEGPSGLVFFCPGCVSQGSLNRIMTLYTEMSACMRQKHRKKVSNG